MLFNIQLEIALAEDILETYKNFQKHIGKGRREYLKDRNAEIKQKISIRDELFQRNAKIKESQNNKTRVKTKIINSLKKMEEKKNWKLPLKETEAIEDCKADLKYFAEKFLSPIREKLEKRKDKQIYEAANILPRSKSHFNLINPEVSKRLHPPSKILVDHHKSPKDFLGLETYALSTKLAQRRNGSVDDFKVGLHSPPSHKNPENFQKYLTGGPSNFEKPIFQVYSFYLKPLILKGLPYS